MARISKSTRSKRLAKKARELWKRLTPEQRHALTVKGLAQVAIGLAQPGQKQEYLEAFLRLPPEVQDGFIVCLDLILRWCITNTQGVRPSDYSFLSLEGYEKTCKHFPDGILGRIVK